MAQVVKDKAASRTKDKGDEEGGYSKAGTGGGMTQKKRLWRKKSNRGKSICFFPGSLSSKNDGKNFNFF